MHGQKNIKLDTVLFSHFQNNEPLYCPKEPLIALSFSITIDTLVLSYCYRL